MDDQYMYHAMEYTGHLASCYRERIDVRRSRQFHCGKSSVGATTTIARFEGKKQNSRSRQYIESAYIKKERNFIVHGSKTCQVLQSIQTRDIDGRCGWQAAYCTVALASRARFQVPSVCGARESGETCGETLFDFCVDFFVLIFLCWFFCVDFFVFIFLCSFFFIL